MNAINVSDYYGSCVTMPVTGFRSSPVKMILESIYEPVFSNKSHGFRPNRSCQTALMQIQKTFTGTNWFVEGDIHACFDSFDHHVIVEFSILVCPVYTCLVCR